MNEFLVAANRTNGYMSIWIATAGCCDICQRMNGRTITSIRPPLHPGCKCMVTAKKQGCFDVRDNASGVTFGVDKEGKYARIGVGDEIYNDRGAPFAFVEWAGKVAKVIASGAEIDDIERLKEFYAGETADWKKMKQKACAERYEEEEQIEIHWYENDKIGCVDYKVK